MSFADSNAFTITPQPSGGSLPAWAAAQADLAIVKPFTSFTNIDSREPAGFPEGSTGSQTNWSSGRWGVYQGRQVYFHMGGGHSDGADGNIYAADPFDRQWKRLTNFPAAYSGGSQDRWGDGTPRVPHTYGQFLWSPGKCWLFGQAGPYPTGNTSSTIWAWDHGTGLWTAMATNFAGGGVGGGVEAASFYSAARNSIYTVNQDGHVWRWNLATNVQTKISSSVPTGANLYNSTAFSDALGALFYRSGPSHTNTISILNVDAGSPAWATIARSGVSFNPGEYAGLMFHARTKKLLGWASNVNRQQLYVLAPPVSNPTSFAQLSGTWSVSLMTFTGVLPDGPEASGTHKKFDICDDLAGSGRDWWSLFSNTAESINFGKLPVSF